MAFDMYAGDAQERIGHHEEFIFDLLEEDSSRYPELSSIWDRFYDGPRLSSQQAGAIVHELIDLLASNGGAGNKQLASVVLRVLPFFSKAFRENAEVRCVSD